MPPTDPSDGDEHHAAIDLGSMSAPPPAPEPESHGPVRPPTGRIGRYTIAVAAGAVIAMTATLLVMVAAFSPDTDAARPTNMAELRAVLLERFTIDVDNPAAQLIEVSGATYTASHVALEPGTYRLALRCGVLDTYGYESREIGLEVVTPRQRYDILMPCPSTTLWLDNPLELGDLSPMRLEPVHPDAFGSFLITVAVVPTEATS